jgi:hypothetical protein
VETITPSGIVVSGVKVPPPYALLIEKAIVGFDLQNLNSLHMDVPVLTAHTISADNAHVEITLQPDGAWAGTWKINNLILKNSDVPLPPLKGDGTLNVTSAALNITGALVDDAKTTGATFEYRFEFSGATNRVRVAEAHLPWSGGKISTRDVIYNVGGKQPTKIELKIDHVPIDEFLQELTGKKATATGVVSGTLPITLMADGKIRIGHGRLQAEAPGIIALQPDAIPGDNEQVVMVREILKNLHYKLLALDISPDKDNKLSIKLALEGHNPDIEKGRPVKLNVHLSGDLLGLLENGVTTLTDPKKFLKDQK